MMSDLRAANSVPSARLRPKVIARRFIPAEKLMNQAVADKMQFLRSLDHGNLVSLEKIFLNRESNFIEVELEFMPVSVAELCVRIFPYHDEVSLAAILGQTIEGLSFLETAGFCHTMLSESQVLADFAGTVKISGLDWCEKGKALPQQLLPLTQHLMYPWMYSERVRVDSTKWAKDSHAFEFWRALSRPTTSLEALSKSGLLQIAWNKSDLRALMLIAFDHVRTEKMRLANGVGCDDGLHQPTQNLDSATEDTSPCA
ncbi:hypothetical protein NLG97_g112 [Lecanicillium saksenae]|uniref:Uncharacterized protein n=1 Tax=Lecanicillium saksenae TaxID=468837 RepID=A0ACC1R9F8_9HYPO|nr:hypothetical protein NLG97_g112 [Lecanicillium saksenae]